MWSDKEYSNDIAFQLELNLQSVRRSLIDMLDDFEAEDCRRCCLLKCRCEQAGVTPPRSPTDSGQNTDDEYKSPPAIDLPRPDFKVSTESSEPPVKDVESWVQASTPNPDQTESPGCKPTHITCQGNYLPPAPRSIWNEYKQKINKPEINTGTVNQANNVQDFFKSFNLHLYTIGAKDAHAKNRAMMQKLKLIADKPSEYTYF